MQARKSHSTPAARGASPQPPSSPSTALPMPSADATLPSDWWSDRYSLLLLTLLYMAQGLPMGLAFGTIPFLLKERQSSYADLAKFSLASLPYSLKLLIAPLVDSFYHRAFGRRKSWIVPAQLTIGLVAAGMASSIQAWVEEVNVDRLTPTFLLLLALTATQDIAVDGWSLTMLQRRNVEYASTCQSLGLSLGFFTNFTIFLAFSNDQFCDRFVRPLLPFGTTGAVVDLQGTLRLVGLYYLCLTIYVTFFKKEGVDDDTGKKSDAVRPHSEPLLTQRLPSRSDEAIHKGRKEPVGKSRSILIDSIKDTYSDMLVVVRKPAVQSLVAALLVAKVGFSAYDNGSFCSSNMRATSEVNHLALCAFGSQLLTGFDIDLFSSFITLAFTVATLKLLELGFSKESMASMAVIQAPCTLFATIASARLMAKTSPTKLYLYGYFSRFLISLTGPACVSLLKHLNGVVTPTFYMLTLTITILYSLVCECLMFIGQGAFFLSISSSSVHVAGSYLTLLNTSANMGGIWHKALVLWLVDQLTWRENCTIPPNAPAGTLCPIMYDGYYILSFALMPVAVAVGVHLLRTFPRLGKLPDSAWQASRRAE